MLTADHLLKSARLECDHLPIMPEILPTRDANENGNIETIQETTKEDITKTLKD